MLPLNFQLDGEVVIFGFGFVGQRKYNFLKKFTKRFVVIDRELPDDLSSFKGQFHQVYLNPDPQSFVQFIPKTVNLVIVALGSPSVEEAIANYCKSERIPVNVVDRLDLCSVTFSSVIKENSLVIAISTEGRCPFYSKQLRKELTPQIKSKSKIMNVLATLREEANQPKDDLNRIYIDKSFQYYLDREEYDHAIERGRELLTENLR